MIVGQPFIVGVMSTLIAEDLLLLLLDDQTGKLVQTSYVDTALGGAVLVELALTGAVEVGAKKGVWSKAKVHPTGAATPEDAVLAHGLATVDEKDRTAQDLVGRLGKSVKETLLERLRDGGILELEENKVLGLFPRKRWPAADSTHEDEVRRSVSDVLIRGVTPDQRTAALIGLLYAIDRAHKTVDRERRSAGEVKKRAKVIAEGDWATGAVKDAVAATQAAVMTAVMVATTSAAGGAAGS